MKLLGLLVGFIMLNGCATHSTHQVFRDTTRSLVDIIPVRDFVANTESNFNYAISPDGLKIAWIAVQGTHTKIHWRLIESEQIHVINGHSSSDINNFIWAQDSETFLTHGSAHRGTEQTHVVSLSIKYPNKNYVDITPFKQSTVRLVKIPMNDPEHIFVVSNYIYKNEYDLYKVNIKTQESILIEKNTGNVSYWSIDDDSNVKMRVSVFDDKVERLERYKSSTDEWIFVDEWSYDDEFGIVGYQGKNEAWILSNTNRDKTALFSMDLKSGKRTFIYGEKEVNLDGVVISKLSKEPKVALSMPDYPKKHFFDLETKKEYKNIQNQINGYLSVLNADNAEQVFVLSGMSEKHVNHYLYQKEIKKLQLIGSHPLSKYSKNLSSTKAISYKSRDGLIINGYVTIPNGFEGKKLPMVLKVHGGPWARDRYGLNSNTQFLANRGYAVLQVNFRGSTGYGKQFDLAGVGEFSQKMHFDLIDGVNWAVEQGIADKNKICIYGHSYGGYSVLVGLSQNPNVFACGVDVAGPTDLVSLIGHFPVYWKNYLSLWHQYVGNPALSSNREQMKKRSPVYKAGQITKPLLIVHGARDPRVRLKQADRMVEALRKEGKEVDYLVFENEGHSITKWTNNLIFYRKLEDFLAKHLGGRSNGFDYYELGKYFF